MISEACSCVCSSQLTSCLSYGHIHDFRLYTTHSLYFMYVIAWTYFTHAFTSTHSLTLSLSLSLSLYCTATNYASAPAQPLHYPAEIPICAANFVAVQNSPKPASWATCTLGTVDPATAAVATAATAIYPAPGCNPENPFPAPQAYAAAAHPQEFYQQGF